jgi:hypothetical protein
MQSESEQRAHNQTGYHFARLEKALRFQQVHFCLAFHEGDKGTKLGTCYKTESANKIPLTTPFNNKENFFFSPH